jgi:hypothetical protein
MTDDRIPTIKLNPMGNNADRSPYTLSFHSAWRLADSLVAYKSEIDARVASGEEDAHYRSLVYDTIATEARHLIFWCRQQDLVTGSDYYEGTIQDLSELICSIDDAV